MTELRVEVAWASSEHQFLQEFELPAGATVADALAAARQASPSLQAAAVEAVGIWGRVVSEDTPLHDKDRVEIYRALRIDPREARRRYAAAGLTMNAPETGTSPRVIEQESSSDGAESGRGRSARDRR